MKITKSNGKDSVSTFEKILSQAAICNLMVSFQSIFRGISGFSSCLKDIGYPMELGALGDIEALHGNPMEL